ncbi:hypothetical protein D9Q98_001981 [Chlorella vulgaris]|uniref:Uncharacterized protein n=1 Tax=Chlorella vulgaris TaxID=3077 RepID=A0A9D4TVJ5_CHLVU|nr:hypothetical protein D9Q98_001981 [Chlorella vulgaris]
MRSLAAAAAPCGTAALTPATASSSGQAIGSMPGMRCLGRTHSSSSSSSPCDTQHHRGQLQRRHGSATVDTCFPSHSDRVRRRRLTSASAAAAAAAQPALAADEVNGAWQALPPQQPALASLLLKPGRSGLLQQQAEVPGNQEVLWQAVQLPGSSPLAALETALLPRRAPFQLPVPNMGYTCMNKTLQQEHGVRTNRSCRRRTFEAEGLPRVSRLALANCRDLLPLIDWNRRHGIHFFRIPSALFPWDSEYELEQLPDWEEIAATLAQVGQAARAAQQRLTAHPSHYVQLASPDPALVTRSLRHLELNARVFDLMGFPPSHTNKINIHVGGTYGDKRRALKHFVAAVNRLSNSCRARLTVENDDRTNLYSIADLLPLHAMAGIPLVFDYLHQALLPGGMSEEEALLAALGTWPAGIRPVVHYSEPSEDAALPRRAHSCMLTRPFRLYGCEAAVDVMLEAKGMEQALLFYRDELLLGRKLETPQAPQKVTAAASRRQSVASL